MKLSIPGFRIPTLFREADGSYWDTKKYPRLSLAQPTTHDHPPLAAAWAECWQNIDTGKDVENNRRELLPDDGVRRVEGPGAARASSRTSCTKPSRGRVLQSPSWLVVFQITDVFAMKERFNTPGSVSPNNWSHRLPKTVKELDEDPRAAGEGRDVLTPGEGGGTGRLMIYDLRFTIYEPGALNRHQARKS